MQLIRLSETTAGLIEVPFTSVLSSSLTSRISGATLPNSGITCYIKKGGVGAAVLGTGTFTTVDDTHALGVRGYQPASGELPLGVSTLIFTGTNMEPREVPVMVVNDDPYRPVYYGALVAGTLTTAAFSTNRTEATTDAWKDALIEFLSGPNVGSVKPVGAYNGTTKVFTLATTPVAYTLPATPTVGDVFRIVTR